MGRAIVKLVFVLGGLAGVGYLIKAGLSSQNQRYQKLKDLEGNYPNEWDKFLPKGQKPDKPNLGSDIQIYANTCGFCHEIKLEEIVKYPCYTCHESGYSPPPSLGLHDFGRKSSGFSLASYKKKETGVSDKINSCYHSKELSDEEAIKNFVITKHAWVKINPNYKIDKRWLDKKVRKYTCPYCHERGPKKWKKAWDEGIFPNNIPKDINWLGFGKEALAKYVLPQAAGQLPKLPSAPATLKCDKNDKKCMEESMQYRHRLFQYYATLAEKNRLAYDTEPKPPPLRFELTNGSEACRKTRTISSCCKPNDSNCKTYINDWTDWNVKRQVYAQVINKYSKEKTPDAKDKPHHFTYSVTPSKHISRTRVLSPNVIVPDEGCSSCHSKSKKLDNKRPCITCHQTGNRHFLAILGPDLKKQATEEISEPVLGKRRRRKTKGGAVAIDF